MLDEKTEIKCFSRTLNVKGTNQPHSQYISMAKNHSVKEAVC